MNRHTLIVTLAISLLWAAPAVAGLKLGDPAPELSITNWVKGSPVELAKLRDQKVVIVEFWATWCGPCIRSIPQLSNLQQKHADELVVIGVTKSGRNNSLSKVENFVEARNKEIAYTIAFDGDGVTFRNYMTAMRRSGIPTSFIVDRSGKLAWVGHPARMHRPLAAILKGGFDSDLANIRLLLRQRIQKTRSAKKVEDEWRALTALHAISPKDKSILLRKFRLDNQLEKWNSAVDTARVILDAGKDNAGMLNTVAWELLTLPGHKGKQVPIALEAAVRANDLTKNKRWAYLDTLALARFESDSLEEAVTLQRRALDLANLAQADAKLLADFEDRLKTFESAAAGAQENSKQGAEK